MNNLIAQVNKWYEGNCDYLAKNFTHVNCRSNQSDLERGAVAFELEAPTLLATITVWNKGDVSAAILKKGSQKPIVLDDRVLDPAEDVPAVLDGYIQQFLSLA